MIVDGLLKSGVLSSTARPDEVRIDRGTGGSAAADVTALFQPGIEAAISYAERSPQTNRDRASSDDVLLLTIDPRSLSLDQVCEHLFPRVVESLDWYRAIFIDDVAADLDRNETVVAEARRTGLDVDGRDSVLSLGRSNYFDEELCLRSFGVAAAEVVRRLDQTGAKGRLSNRGVIVELPLGVDAGRVLAVMSGSRLHPSLEG